MSSSASILKTWFLGGGGSSSSAAGRAATALPRILLLDGGVSTHLESKGATFAHRQLWSSSLLLTGPDRITAGHKDWFRDGKVNLISTVTYQCHYEQALWPYGENGSSVIRDEDHMDELWQQAVQLANQAATSSSKSNGDRFQGIIASSGCFGAALSNGAEYTGDYGPDRTIADLRAFHERKLRAIRKAANMNLDSQVDGVAIETVPSLAECQALRDLFCDNSSSSSSPPTDMACWISLACRNGRELNDGTPVTKALEVLCQIPVDRVQAFGFNCCAAKDLPLLVDVMLQQEQQSPNEGEAASSSSSSPRGIVLYPNSGETWDAEKQEWQEASSSSSSSSSCCDHNGGAPHGGGGDAALADLLMTCIRQIDAATPPGSRKRRIIVGGCCRTTPTHLAAVRQHVDDYLTRDLT